MAGYNLTRFVEELLERTESSPPSFTVHLHLEYWTLNQGSKFLYNNQIAVGESSSSLGIFGSPILYSHYSMISGLTEYPWTFLTSLRQRKCRSMMVRAAEIFVWRATYSGASIRLYDCRTAGLSTPAKQGTYT